MLWSHLLLWGPLWRVSVGSMQPSQRGESLCAGGSAALGSWTKSMGWIWAQFAFSRWGAKVERNFRLLIPLMFSKQAWMSLSVPLGQVSGELCGVSGRQPTLSNETFPLSFSSAKPHYCDLTSLLFLWTARAGYGLPLLRMSTVWNTRLDPQQRVPVLWARDAPAQGALGACVQVDCVFSEQSCGDCAESSANETMRSLLRRMEKFRC